MMNRASVSLGSWSISVHALFPGPAPWKPEDPELSVRNTRTVQGTKSFHIHSSYGLNRAITKTKQVVEGLTYFLSFVPVVRIFISLGLWDPTAMNKVIIYLLDTRIAR